MLSLVVLMKSFRGNILFTATIEMPCPFVFKIQEKLIFCALRKTFSRDPSQTNRKKLIKASG